MLDNLSQPNVVPIDREDVRKMSPEESLTSFTAWHNKEGAWAHEHIERSKDEAEQRRKAELRAIGRASLSENLEQ